MNLDWINLILILGALQGGVLALFLFFVRSENAKANHILGILVLLFSFNLLLEVIYDSGEYANWPMLIGLDTPIDFLYGPLLWYYTSMVTRDSDLAFKKQFWQFIPAILIVVLWSEFYFAPAQEKIDELKRLLDNPYVEEETAFYWGLMLIHGISYSIWVIHKVHRFQGKIKQTRSQIDGINLQWLVVLTAVIGLLWLGASAQIMMMTFQVNVSRGLIMLPTVGIVLMIYLIGYMAMRQPAIFKGVNESIDDNKSENVEQAEKKQTHQKIFQLSPERAKIIGDKLESIMRKQELFLQPDLKLRHVAEVLSIPEHHLTLVLNDHLNQSFFDYINQQRIERAKQLLRSEDYKNQSVLDIGFAVGFNSKSTFYSLFKQSTQTTPAKFRTA